MSQPQRFVRWITCLGVLLVAAPIRSQVAGKPQIGATLTISDLGSWRPLQQGIEFRRMVLERTEPNAAVELKLVRFDTKVVTPRILQSADFQLKGASAKVFAENSGALAAINASYFDERSRPLAYLKNLEKEINRTVSKHALYTGIFAIREAVPAIMHRDEFQPGQASDALQTGPLLLNHGNTVEVMNGLGRLARRSVIGIDKVGRVVIGVTDAVLGGLSFAELQELFNNPKWRLETPDLLNLDGGGSAQLYLKAGKFQEWIPGTAEVPVAIGFFARPN
jgi:uncharacterized protein YigE (DUF2233 family)